MSLQISELRNKKGQHHRCAGRGRICCRNRYLVQLWLTIFKLITRSSPSSPFWPPFLTWPSFFSSALVSRVGEPVTVTWWPTWSESLTVLLRKSQLLPSSPVMENSSGWSPFCRQPVTAFVSLADFSCGAVLVLSCFAWS